MLHARQTQHATALTHFLLRLPYRDSHDVPLPFDLFRAATMQSLRVAAINH
jgi:hypothetical protein